MRSENHKPKKRRPSAYKICGISLPSVRAANVFYHVVTRKKLLVYEELEAFPWQGKLLKESTPAEVAASIELEDLEKTRNCGKLSISQITAALIKAKVRPKWKWPQKKQWPKWIVQKCPSCGTRLYA